MGIAPHCRGLYEMESEETEKPSCIIGSRGLLCRLDSVNKYMHIDREGLGKSLLRPPPSDRLITNLRRSLVWIK